MTGADAHLGATQGRLLPRLSLLLAPLIALLFAIVALPGQALALKPIVVDPEQERIELTNRGEFYDDRGDSLQVETAPAADGMTGRISVTAKTPGTNPNWIVFALTNQTDKPIERWLTAERYNIIGSGAIWPDLDARRIEAVTPSIGYVPERIKSDRADIFRITLEPGQTITYVAELSSERVARVFLWKPLEYELTSRDRLLFNGIMLGLTGLLAIFLTAIFAANHKAIFPSAALVAWCVLAYLCVDFGFFHKMFQLRPEDNAVYRAACESAVAASLVIFLSVFLRIAFWHNLIRMLFTVWMIAQLTLVAVAVIDPRLASTFARTSFLIIGAVGGAFTLFLAMRGQDRALSLIPTWILFLIWIFAAAMTLTGRLSGDITVSALVAGLVLILVLIGFTVTQFAFRSLEPLYGAAPSELQLRALAVDGAGSAVWEWNARRDEIKVSPVIEASLGLSAGELSTKVDEFMKHLHPADRDRFRLILWSMQERTWAKIRTDFRMRHADNSYRWFELEAASVPNADARALRCVGLIRDVTDAKRSHERLLHDAVHDSLTGLPNRELMLDRLGVAVMRAKQKDLVRPSIFFIDIDKFKSVNVSFGLVVGDSLLLTVARRLQTHLGPQDTLARVGGDQFAVLLLSEQSPQELASMAERLRRSLRAPIKIAGQEIVLTGSLGIAVYDGSEPGHLDLYKEAEIAMYRAKRGGADRIEIFRPEMRGDRDDRVALESDLRKALAKNQIRVLYQPIIYLPTEELAGFEALVRWEHPKHGLMNPVDFVPIAEESDLIVKLGSHVLLRAAHEAARWQRELPRDEDPLFVSVNVSSRQIFRQNLIQEIRHILGRNIVPKGSLRLEITESLVMENPEQATEILEWLRGAGAELALDDFGTGYSSLAYLQRFPFDTIKIDRALVQSSGSSNGSGGAIVRSIVALAHELGKKVVAEGVEAAEDVAFLRSVGCQYAQGFYYGEPMSERDVLQLLKMVRTAEHKLRPRGFFRPKSKTAQNEGKGRKKARGATPTPVHANGNGSEPPPPPASDLPPALGASVLPNSTVRPRTARPVMSPPPPPIASATPVEFGGLPPPALLPPQAPPSPITAALLPLLAAAAAPPAPSAFPPPPPISEGLMPLMSSPPASQAASPAEMLSAMSRADDLGHSGRGGADAIAPPLSHSGQPPPPAPVATTPPPLQAPAAAPPPPAVPMQVLAAAIPAAGLAAPVANYLARSPAATPAAQATVPPATPATTSLDPEVMVAALKEAAARHDDRQLAPTPLPSRSPAPQNGADAAVRQPKPTVHATASSVTSAGKPEPRPDSKPEPKTEVKTDHQLSGAPAMPVEDSSVDTNGSGEAETSEDVQANGQRRARIAGARRAAKKAPTAEPARATPDFSGLPPAMAQSLARLAGVPWPPPKGPPGGPEGGLDKEAASKKSRG
jgi:diguanylate cyclase (GGDEF)-like protein/PAS domain S-box-containing protein